MNIMEKISKALKRTALLGICLFIWDSAVIGQKPAPPDESKKQNDRGQVSVCKEIDDDWKCVGEAATWEANKKFNVLFINPIKVGVDFIGIIFHKQLPDGKDGEFLYEFQQQIGSENRKYATTEAPFYLPAGNYTIYIITWGKRETLVHNGNLTDYLAKMTLKVK